MQVKYHIETRPAPHRAIAISRLSSVEFDGCLGCLRCVKRESCVYDVYRRRFFDPAAAADSADALCVGCMRCVQECKKNVLSRRRNPAYDRLGDEHWTPEIVTGIWKQAETGKIPVSGAGYRGPFTGDGFDAMWTDMSEIVRPTRDGIHGREYISTAIQIGARPSALRFGPAGRPEGRLPPFLEIPIPVLLEEPQVAFAGEATRMAVATAARELRTLQVVTAREASRMPLVERGGLVVRFDPASNDRAALDGVAAAEIPYGPRARDDFDRLRSLRPDMVVAVRILLDEHAARRAVELAAAGGEVLRFQGDRRARGLGRRRKESAAVLVREIHECLVERGLRDRVTVLYSGGIAAAEHVAKVIICGADGAVVDAALAVAMGCRLCPDCLLLRECPAGIDRVPEDWGARRIVNLMASWHSQLLEVLGAMGLREVRRLRGELGRAMFFEDLERECFGPLFGRRETGAAGSDPRGLAAVGGRDGEEPTDGGVYPPAAALVAACPSRFRNRLCPHRVVRTSQCAACGKCAEVCPAGVHRKGGTRMLAPRSHLCRGLEDCRAAGAACVDACPRGALRVGPDPSWEAFGDRRWPAELLAATWLQAETGRPPRDGLEHRVGASGGGFDRMEFVFPEPPAGRGMRREDVDLSVPLNRRRDGRPEVTIGVPFYGGGMSFGSVSLPTMVARAKAYKAFRSFTCTGEGGYPAELVPFADHVITQVATGLFGVREETIQRAPIVEFKYAQGAKPGLGGHLLGDKVTPEVARMREAVVGSALFSPFPFHSVYSVEDHKKHVDWIKAVNPRVLVSVKVSTPTDVDMVAVGSYHAGAHVLHLDGSYGGTGAAPDIAKKNIAMPIEYAVPKVHRFLVAEGIRDRLTVVASGGLRTAWDVAKAIALGADAVVIGTAELVALECIRCGACESGRGCPRGIATTDPELSKLVDPEWAAQRLINLFHSWAVQLQGILWRLGLASVRDLVGRHELLAHLDYDNSMSGRQRMPWAGRTAGS